MARHGLLGQPSRLEPARGSPPSCASSRCDPHAAQSGRAGGAVRGAGRAPSHALGRRTELDPQPGAVAAARAVPVETAAHSAPRGLASRTSGPRSARKSPSWGSSSQRVSSKVSARAQLLTRESLFGWSDHLRRCLPSEELFPWLPSYLPSGVSTGVLPCRVRVTVIMPTTTLADVAVTKRSSVSFPRGCLPTWVHEGCMGAGAVRLEKRLPTLCCFIPEPALVVPPPPPLC